MTSEPDAESIQPAIALWCADPARQEEAAQLAQELSLPVLSQADPADESWSLLLILSDTGLSLQQTGRKRPGPVVVDFVSGAAAHRRLYGGGKGQLIARACGLKAGVLPSVVDVTAGLGRDGFVLATLGCRVTLLERAPLVHALLRDGLARAARDLTLASILQRITLHRADGREWLTGLSGSAVPDVIYVDPMFPHSDKSAQVKKEMLLFRDLIGADADEHELLAAALATARCRVVVKRPRKAPAISGPPPSLQLDGKSCRYDIYTLQKIEAALG